MPFTTPDEDLNAFAHQKERRIVEPGRDAWRIVSVYIAASLFWVLFSDLILNGLDVAASVYQAIQYVKSGVFILVSGSIFYLILQHKLQQIRLSDETILKENAKLARTVNNLKIIELSLRRQQSEQAGLSENLRMEKQKLHRLAYEDPMTGLPNRARLVEDGARLIEASQGRARQLTCIHLDVDNFKQINETLGMAAADTLLVDLAGLLKSLEQPGIRTYRLNGDEFALVLTHVPDRAQIAATIDQIFECFSRPWRLEGQSLFITVSAGIAVYPDHGEDMIGLMQSAHAALSHAKAKGCNSWMFFDSWMRESSWKNIRLYNNLQQAINHGQFKLHYQPLVDLVTDSIIGLEALIRWPDQAGGFYPPMEFIPFSESTGQIAAISDWVVREVYAQRQTWLSQGVRLVDISINLSGNLLSDGQVIPLFERLARQSGRTWQGIEIEITETAAVSNFEQTIAVLGRLKELGFSIALDDFGTGYSSLTYLRKLPIDRIKIDRSFLRDIIGDHNHRTIYQSIVTLAHQLGLEVVAEGVETVEQLLMLKAIGCDFAQGYYLSRPLPAAEIRLLLEKDPGPRSMPFSGGVTASSADQAFSTRKR
ncbi:MAG: bifunctional diguanylate cyclase/phosphodiesterase [Eubacteriales bacterium]|nr:bifunctional diguanylate cyclase/phosphodiesterase [Eubacteriales bacterium]